MKQMSIFFLRPQYSSKPADLQGTNKMKYLYQASAKSYTIYPSRGNNQKDYSNISDIDWVTVIRGTGHSTMTCFPDMASN